MADEMQQTSLLDVLFALLALTVHKTQFTKLIFSTTLTCSEDFDLTSALGVPALWLSLRFTGF